MKEISIDKVTLNIGVGEAGEKLNKAVKLLEHISGEKAIQTKSKGRIPTWGIRPGLPIATKVTVRKEKAVKLLKRLFIGVNNKITQRNFDQFGNFAFGIKEYLEIPDTKYDPAVGVIGLEAAVTLKRPGYRVKLRRMRPGKIGKSHQITKQEAIDYVQKTFNIEVSEK